MTIDFRLDGKTLSIYQAEAEALGVTATALVKALIHTAARNGTIQDLVAGVDVADFQNRRYGRRPRHVVNGRYRSMREIAEECGIPEMTLRDRLRRGWSIEKAMSEPVRPWGGAR